MHVLAKSSVLPAALASVALVCPDPQTPELTFWLRTKPLADSQVLFTLTTTVDEHLIDTASSPLRFVRDDALSALRFVVPFIDEHAIWIDSPHDGLPPHGFRSSGEPSYGEPWSRGPSTMRPIHEYPTRRALGVCALPTRTPVRGVFLCNEQVAPGLGLEGSFLAASSAARVAAARYRRREWLRRGPWARRSV